MTKNELIELLVDLDDDMKIGFAFPSGDYWRTTIVRGIEEVSEGDVQYSNYHEENILVNKDNLTDEERNNRHERMIILS